jgi:phosphatidate cytidylyltransferase
MAQRIIVAVIFIPIMLGLIYLGGLWSVALFLVMGLLGAHEFYRMLEVGEYHPAIWYGLVWTTALILHGWRPDLFPYELVLTAGLLILLIYTLFQEEQPLRMFLSTATVAVYIGIMIANIIALRLLPEGMWWLLMAILITWSNDTLAYFTGVTIGKHKLWPRLSPKKSWEGTVGGFLGAALAGGLVAMLSPLSIGFGLGALIGLIGGILALFGDLSISMVKRQVGVKDSGHLIPGHGGMLDRLDSVLFVVPFVYLVVNYWVLR